MGSRIFFVRESMSESTIGSSNRYGRQKFVGETKTMMKVGLIA